MQFKKKETVQILRNSGGLEEAVVTDIYQEDYMVTWKENGKKRGKIFFKLDFPQIKIFFHGMVTILF